MGRVDRRLSARAGGAHERGEQRDCPGRRAVGVRVVGQDGAVVGRVERCLSARARGGHVLGEQRDRPGRRAAGVRVERRNNKNLAKTSFYPK